jgi:hypothetical protein
VLNFSSKVRYLQKQASIKNYTQTGVKSKAKNPATKDEFWQEKRAFFALLAANKTAFF